MLSIEHNWVIYLLPIPLIITWLLPKVQQQLAALQVPSLAQWSLTEQNHIATPTRNLGRRLLLILMWCCLLAAAANPIWYGEPISQQAEGRDILLAVDISGSMRIKDMSLKGRSANRLQASKSVISDFVSQRQGDRLGLILFGSQAYMHVPLTSDTRTLVQLLNEAQIGYAGRETAIGDAIGLGLKRLHSLDHNERIMILLTDGSNSAGTLDPLKAAQLAAEAKLKIYTIGVGSRQGLRAQFGINGGGGIDENALNTIAKASGGQFFRAGNTDDLQGIYRYIDELEPTPEDATTIRPQKSLAWPFIAGATLLSVLLCLLQLIQQRRPAYDMA